MDLPRALVTPLVREVSRGAGMCIFEMALANVRRVLNGQALQNLLPGLDGETGQANGTSAMGR